ncbi:MAG TPA: D-tyrosyl-tRNA(Tyr) deacylase [Candidatus Scybalocola faecavium]|nr:D-tyrosyl-tRNA(Tyr) deacylase [Candidatus Scybalocola faecavium]
MKAVIQRVSKASVDVEGQTIGKIGKGFMVLLGVHEDDTQEDLNYLVKKVTGLRIFEDSQGKMNLSLADVGGSLLVISQFTLLASTKKGNRPSFIQAGAPQMSEGLYEQFMEACRNMGFHVEHGKFGAHMDVSLINDGPVTIIIDSRHRE